MRSVLIIEDDAKFRSILRQQLEPVGFVVDEAADGAEGLKRIALQKPDIVLVDLLMPNKEGIETIREIRASEPSIRIIAMSGGGQAHAVDFLRIAKALGANSAIAKPFRIQDLLTSIAELT